VLRRRFPDNFDEMAEQQLRPTNEKRADPNQRVLF
jgi:hypothetical protein